MIGFLVNIEWDVSFFCVGVMLARLEVKLDGGVLDMQDPIQM